MRTKVEERVERVRSARESKLIRLHRCSPVLRDSPSQQQHDQPRHHNPYTRLMPSNISLILCHAEPTLFGYHFSSYSLAISYLSSPLMLIVVVTLLSASTAVNVSCFCFYFVVLGEGGGPGTLFQAFYESGVI